MRYAISLLYLTFSLATLATAAWGLGTGDLGLGSRRPVAGRRFHRGTEHIASIVDSGGCRATGGWVSGTASIGQAAVWYHAIAMVRGHGCW